MNVPSAPPRRAVLLWLTVLKPPKAGASADRSHDPLLAPHGTYVLEKAIGTLLNGHVTRDHRAGPFSHVPPAPPRRAILLWLKVLKLLKTVASSGHSADSILAPHETHV